MMQFTKADYVIVILNGIVSTTAHIMSYGREAHLLFQEKKHLYSTFRREYYILH